MKYQENIWYKQIRKTGRLGRVGNMVLAKKDGRIVENNRNVANKSKTVEMTRQTDT
jgi:hypothetical protein